tara:strand:- start:246 stop:884 length:639 start_codon:yes stop_codon:yes gene_type:complete
VILFNSMIYIHNVKKSRARLSKEYDHSIVIDVSSKAELPYLKFSPFYPHGDIPVPFSKGLTSESVEGVWQGLKVFRESDIDLKKLSIKNMSGIKRPARFYGKPLGHRKGIDGELIDYLEARKLIYVPCYLWMLKNKTHDLILELYHKARETDIILLDYTTNENLEDLSKPLSHASLIKQMLMEMDQSNISKRFSTLIKNKNKDDGQTELKFE